MKKWIVAIILAWTITSPIHISAQQEQSSRYLIHSTVFDIQQIEKMHNVTTSFDILPVVELKLTPSEVEEIKLSFPNASASLVQKYENASFTDKVPAQFPMINTQPTQTTPYTGKGVKVAVLDTGIDVNHPDLKVVGGICTLDQLTDCSKGTTYDDDLGHGTHVAGIIAAKKNNLGIVGVAPRFVKFQVCSMRFCM